MKMKTQLTLAAVVAAGLLASGCSQQMVAQQAVAQQVAPEPVVKTIVDCSKCGKPAAPRGGGNQWTHTHPAIPGCTDSTTHTHKYTNRNHTHKYSCRKSAPRRAAPRPAPAPRPMPAPAPRVDPNAHTHPAIPGCTNSTTHSHPNGNRPHSHRYSCRKAAPRGAAPVQRARPPVKQCWHGRNARGQCNPRPAQRQYQQVAPMMPKVKAKGTYRGPIQIDGVMQQYQN
ncbi:MAG: hypothetical protein R3F02_15390 [Thiolinea sp.]